MTAVDHESNRLAFSHGNVYNDVMPKISTPPNATRLWRWMDEHRVTLNELAGLVGYASQYLSDVRRGVCRPSDTLKVALQDVTLQLEEQRGIAEPRGVRAADWFDDGKVAAS